MQVLFLLLILSQIMLCQSNPDTSKPFSIFIIGKISQNHKSEISLDQFEMLDYKTPADIIALEHNLFTNELGENGKPVNLNFNFTDARSSQFLLNGRTLNAYIYPYLSLNMLPMDNIFMIETNKSFYSPVFSNANSSITNFIFKNTFTSKPITRIRYIEDAYDLTISDGSFSYNVLRNLNFTFGFRRNTSTGRFTNSQYDAWNLFLNSFWIPQGKLKISILNIYTTEHNGLNGGIDTTNLSLEDENIIYNERIAPVVEPNSNLSSKRNDLTLTSAYKVDSLSEIDLILYHTFQEDKFSSLKDPNERKSSFYGLKFNLLSSIRAINLNACLEIQKSNLNISLLNDSISTGYLRQGSKSLTSFSSSLKADFKLGEFVPSTFIRIENLSGKTIANYGLGLLANIEPLKIYAGLSRSFRVPTLLEQIITGSSEFERHTIYEAGCEYETKNLLFETRIRNHRISNYLVFRDSSFSRNYLSRTFLEIGSAFRIWKLAFNINPSVILNRVPKPYPGYFLRGEFFFEGKLTKTLHLKAGARVNLSDKFYGFRFINSAFLFTENETELKKFTVIDLFISGRIKSVVIFLTLANATDAKYMTSAFYPMQNRSLRLGVVWTFFD